MDNRQKIIQLIRSRGPSLPVHISKQIGTNILMASAIMSEMVSNGTLKVSNLKIGGSPLYYLPGQESKLENFSDKLNPKDRQTMEKLRNKKVLREKTLQPLTRVSLRKIKDFSRALKVRTEEGIEIFWKWHSLPDSQAEEIIREMLGKKPEVKVEEKPQKEEPESIEPQETEKKEQRQEASEEPNKEEKPDKKQEEPKKKEKKEEEPKEEKFVDTTVEDEFLDIIKKFMDKNEIEIIEQEVVRKSSDINLVIRVPSAVGPLKFYCKAKSKKKSNHTDLAAAMVQGQMKKLPAMYLTTGEVTQTAKDMLHKEFKGMVLKQIEWEQQ